MARGEGKSSWLARRVTQAQDAGADPCAIIVPNLRHVDHWYKNLMHYEIDPSRFMIFVPGKVDLSRGQQFTLVGIDDADLIPDLKKTLEIMFPSFMFYSDRITVTHTESIEELSK